MRRVVVCLLFAVGCDAARGSDLDHEVALGGSIPPYGSPDTFEVATWNLEWFGSWHEGPRDEALQLANVRTLIAGLEVDLWGVEEVVSASQFDDLLAGLPYDGLLASDPSVEGSSDYGAGEQKVGIIFRPDQLEVVAARTVLRERSWAFAGRPPLEVELRHQSGATFYLVVLHAKAMAGLADWQRRRDGAFALADYLADERAGDDVLVIGDYNDDLDQSTRSSSPSPYANLVASHYFPTYAIAQANQPTTVHGRLPIDHALATGAMEEAYVSGSAAVFPADDYIDDYGDTTSDHLPVVMRFDPDSTGEPPALMINEILANEPGSDTAGELVEIVNPSAEPVDAGGFTLSDSFAERRVLPAGTRIAAGAALVLSGAGLGLDNAGETVTLADAGGAVVDRVVYDASLASRDGVSMTRTSDGDPGSPMVLHDQISTLPASPGLRSDGSPF